MFAPKPGCPCHKDPHYHDLSTSMLSPLSDFQIFSSATAFPVLPDRAVPELGTAHSTALQCFRNVMALMRVIAVANVADPATQDAVVVRCDTLVSELDKFKGTVVLKVSTSEPGGGATDGQPRQRKKLQRRMTDAGPGPGPGPGPVSGPVSGSATPAGAAVTARPTFGRRMSGNWPEKALGLITKFRRNSISSAGGGSASASASGAGSNSSSAYNPASRSASPEEHYRGALRILVTLLFHLHTIKRRHDTACTSALERLAAYERRVEAAGGRGGEGEEGEAADEEEHEEDLNSIYDEGYWGHDHEASDSGSLAEAVQHDGAYGSASASLPGQDLYPFSHHQIQNDRAYVARAGLWRIEQAQKLCRKALCDIGNGRSRMEVGVEKYLNLLAKRLDQEEKAGDGISGSALA